MTEIKIVVATHKPYWMPKDSVYLPVQVGAACHAAFGLQTDDSGDNISTKNGRYCELTALYWAWKNLTAGYLGLAHYRRYLAQCAWGEKHLRIANGPCLDAVLQKHDVLLPKPRRYGIETNYSHYVHAHGVGHLEAVKAILQQFYPEYIPAFNIVMGRTWGHRFNMFLMRRDLADAYCTWIFDVLQQLEQRLPPAGGNDRVCGYVAERLLDVWIVHNGHGYVELPFVVLENEHWPKKIAAFLKRKVFGWP